MSTYCLHDLEHVSRKKVEAQYIEKPEELFEALFKYRAATSADSNGAINVYIGDDGWYYCVFMRFLVDLDKQKLDNFEDAEKWTRDAFKKMK